MITLSTPSKTSLYPPQTAHKSYQDPLLVTTAEADPEYSTARSINFGCFIGSSDLDVASSAANYLRISATSYPWHNELRFPRLKSERSSESGARLDPWCHHHSGHS